MILKSAQKILQPYTLKYEYCDWWTAYQIGQRVGDKFSFHDRVFLAGDAVHTHSPKAGQGMNVSMQDSTFYHSFLSSFVPDLVLAYNLGWKLASVINKTSHRGILKTYESERRAIAQELITFDHKFSRLFSGRPAKNIMDEEGISMDEFKRVFREGAMFASGIAVDYGPSVIVAKESEEEEKRGDPSNKEKRVVGKQNLAPNIRIGMRFPSHQILNQSSARPLHFQELLKSTGQWRLIVFAADILDPTQSSRIRKLGEELEKPNSFLTRYNTQRLPDGSKRVVPNSTIEVLTLHSSPRISVNLLEHFSHDVFHPFSEIEGWDYWKVFVDDESYHEGHGHAYRNYGVDEDRGCVVLVRPDGYVSYIGEIEDCAVGGEVEAFLGSFMREA
jgi:phenol 2-monooxygenase (NADPH)